MKRIIATGFLLLLWLPLVRAADSDCIEKGGRTVCSAQEPKPWAIGLCDEANYNDSPNWCATFGGVWSYEGHEITTCRGATPTTEATVYSRAQTFVNNFFGPGCVGDDTGWGATNASASCWSGGPTRRNGLLVSDLRRIVFNCPRLLWSIQITAAKWRSLDCPAGSYYVDMNGFTACVRQVNKNNCGSGNPILIGSGEKFQVENDGTFEGRALTRTYRSKGSVYQAGGGPLVPSYNSRWRINFDYRLFTITDSASAIAALSFPDGTIQYFSPGGSALLSTADSSLRLVTLASGYEVVGGTELLVFDAAGHLIELRTGTLRLSFVFADGTTGANGALATDSEGNPLRAPVPAGELLGVISNNGRTLRFDHDEAGRLTRISQQGIGLISKYYYDGADHIIRVTYADGSARLYHYNESELTQGADLTDALTGISEQTPANVVSRYATYRYTSDGRALSTEHANGVERFTITQVDATHYSVLDPLGTARTVTVDEIQGIKKLAGTAQPGGSGCAPSVSNAAYDLGGDPLSEDDFNGTRTCLASDVVRHLETSKVEGLPVTTSCATVLALNSPLPAGGRRTSTEYHPDWKLDSRQAAPLKLNTMIYNGQPDSFAGGVISSCAPSTALLPDGKPIVVLCKRVEQATTDADGHLGFSAALDSSVVARQQSWTYNEYGQVLLAKGPRTDVNDTTTYIYYSDTTPEHTMGDLAQVTNAVNQTTSYTNYNPNGQLLRMVDPSGVVTVNTYDSRQRLTSSTAGGLQTTYGYDPVGQLIRLTLPDTTAIAYTYDDAHRLTKITDQAGNAVSYTLDNAGNRTQDQVTDANGGLSRTVTRAFDALGRVQQVTGAAQ